ncbi:MAG: hypothetical protein PHV17_03220 [Candidatus Omnitrophica bacterium]|nr:hypothetical protein [Candidatus Omnitrophota bacterium]
MQLMFCADLKNNKQCRFRWNWFALLFLSLESLLMLLFLTIKWLTFSGEV